MELVKLGSVISHIRIYYCMYVRLDSPWRVKGFLREFIFEDFRLVLVNSNEVKSPFRVVSVTKSDGFET